MVTLSEICKIQRGGSPRPIQKFITSDANGINWIKIGDTNENGKYIFKTEEKITAEGAKKSRFVKEGDFILSNSMSFGRPYIVKTTGCIHDGWLLLSDINDKVDKDFLYYILSDKDTQDQFENSATGGVVRNLNADLVRQVKIPLPSIEVQRGMVEEMEKEEEIIASNRKLIEVMEQKISDVLSEI
jgi:restriction endonuclease S subunit